MTASARRGIGRLAVGGAAVCGCRRWHHPRHLEYRVLRAFRRAGIDADRARGALVHGLRHTFATGLANADVSVYTLMKLLGHESIVTSQRNVTAVRVLASDATRSGSFADRRDYVS